MEEDRNKMYNATFIKQLHTRAKKSEKIQKRTQNKKS